MAHILTLPIPSECTPFQTIKLIYTFPALINNYIVPIHSLTNSEMGVRIFAKLLPGFVSSIYILKIAQSLKLFDRPFLITIYCVSNKTLKPKHGHPLSSLNIN